MTKTAPEVPARTLPVHPFEKVGAAKWLRLPLLGVEVIVRRVDVDAITADAFRATLSTGTLKEVAQKWAAEAAEAAQQKDGKAPRPQPALAPEDEITLSIEAGKAVLRNAVVTPTLDELLTTYGAAPDNTYADLGLGTDYSVLMAAVNEMNPTSPNPKEAAAAKEGEKSPGAAVPPPARRGAKRTR